MTKQQTGKVYESPDTALTVEVIAVPGGVLYITAHHQWCQMNTVFVKGENTQSLDMHIDYDKAYRFLTNTEDKDESKK